MVKKGLEKLGVVKAKAITRQIQILVYQDPAIGRAEKS